MATDTKDRILDSAEYLFSEHGIASTSLRLLTEHAGVNLASVNYHFQSKDALVQAVLSRRIQPINQRRLVLLEAAVTEAGGQPPPLERVLEAFFRPVVEASLQSHAAGRPIGALIGRIYTEPGELLIGQMRSIMSDLAARFTEVLRQVLPHLPPDVIFWRLHFSVGILAHTFGAMELIQGLSRGRVRFDDPEEILRQMIAYAVGGFAADVPARQGARV